MRTSSLSTLANNIFIDSNNSPTLVRKQSSTRILRKENNRETSIGRTVTKMLQENNPDHLHQRSKSYNLNENRETLELSNKRKRSQREILPSSTSKNKNLKNFIKNEQSSEIYVKDFNYSKKTSFLFNNRLTKSVFDINDAAMIGKPQGLKEFKSARGGYYGSQQDGFGLLKTAVRKITGRKDEEEETRINKTKQKNTKKSLIPQVYQKAFSISNLEQQHYYNKNSPQMNKKEELNLSLDKSFFPTTTIPEKDLQQHKLEAKQAAKKTVPSLLVNENESNSKKESNFLNSKKKTTTIISTTTRINTLHYRNKLASTQSLMKPSTERKLRNIDNKLQELCKHNESLIRLIPIPKAKQEKVVVKGRGEMISLERITRVVDKLLSVLELYFQMFGENGCRVMDYIKNVEGFIESGKLKEVFCCYEGGGNDMGQGKEESKSGIVNDSKININSNDISKGTNNMAIKHMQSNTEILQHFWIYKKEHEKQQLEIQRKQSNLTEKNNLKYEKQQQFLELPEFWGEEDYALYKLLNNFCLKLESKYENTHKEKFKKMGEIKVERDVKGFDKLYKETSGKYRNSNNNNSSNHSYMNPTTLITQLSIHSNHHLDRKSLLQKIKYQPINSDRKICNQMEELEDLGVKFDFRQKGRSIILAEKSEILYSNNNNVCM